MNKAIRKLRGPPPWLAARPWWFWEVIALLMPTLYIASFGPACWISSRFDDPNGFNVQVVELAYQPLLRATVGENEVIGESLRWYIELGAAPKWHVEGLCFSNDAIWTPR